MNLNRVDDCVIEKLLSDYAHNRNYNHADSMSNSNRYEINTNGTNNNNETNMDLNEDDNNVLPVERLLQQDVQRSFPSVRNFTQFRMNDKVFVRDVHVAWKNYLELIENIRNSSASSNSKNNSKSRIGDELWKTCFPLFVYIFIQIFDYGFILIARNFFIEYSQKFVLKKNQVNILKSIESSLDSQRLDEALQIFKNIKFRVMVTEESFDIITRFLKHEKHMPILQIFNSCMDFRVMTQEEYNNQQNLQKSQKNDCDPCDSRENSLEENLANPNNSDEMNSILSVIKSVRDLDDCSEPQNDSDPANDTTVCLLRFQSKHISSVALSKNLSKVFAGNEHSEIVLWDCDLTDELQYYSSRICKHWKRTPVRQLPSELDFKYIDLKQFSDQSESEDVNDPQIKTKVDPLIFRGHSDPVHEMSLLFDSNTLLSCSSDATIRAWDVNSGSSTAIYNGHPSSIWSMDSQESGCFVSGGSDGVALMWDVQRTIPLRMYPGHLMDINQIRYHPNGNYFATASADHSIILWDVNQVRQVRMFVSEQQLSVHSIQFSACGKFLISGSEDGFIRIWDISQNDCLKMFRNPRETPIRCVTLRSDNNLLACCDARSTKIRVWPNPLNLYENRQRSSIDVQGTTTTADEPPTLLQLQFIRPKVLLAIAKNSDK